jgi:hypothetical protein
MTPSGMIAVLSGTDSTTPTAYRHGMHKRSPFFAVITLVGFLVTAALVMALGASFFEPPVVSSVTPTPIVASASAQVLTVSGTGFAPGLTVEVTSQGNTATFTGAAVQGQRATMFEISAVLAQTGAATLVVRNTDGGVSDPFALTVVAGPVKPQPPTPAPMPTAVIDRVEPEKATRSSVAQPIMLSGKQFAAGLAVTVTDPTGTVRVIEANALEAVTPTSVRFQAVLDISGDYTFTVTNPKGQASNTVTVVVT